MRIRQTRKNPFKAILIFLVLVVAGFFGVKFYLDTRDVPRESDLIFEASLFDSEKSLLKNLLKNDDGAFTKFALPINVSAKISAVSTDFTISKLVPVTDWYSLETSISSEEALSLPLCQTSTSDATASNSASGSSTSSSTSNSTSSSTSSSALSSTSACLLSPESLDGTQKLLAIDDNYYLDDTSKGALYRNLELSLASEHEVAQNEIAKPESTENAAEPSAKNAEIITKSASDPKYQAAATLDLDNFKSRLKSKLEENVAKTDEVLTFAQTGVTALSRAMVTKLNQVGNGAYFAENIKDFLSAKDLTHISNEVSFADNCPGGSNTVVLCSDWRMLDAITAIGTDIIELTGNHNDDYGFEANLNTLAKYEELGLKTFGGGKNAEAAKIPLEIDQKGAKITLIGINYSTTTAAYGGATATNPGANLYDEATTKQQIADAKARGDFVIVDIQYYECYCYPDGYVEMPACDSSNNPAGEQAFFRGIADMGADLVIGTQAHQPQTYELYNGTPIYYGLGNLFFDQTYWPGTTRGLILTHYFLNGQYAQTVISPTIYDATYQTKLMDSADATAFLQRLLNSSPRGEE